MTDRICARTGGIFMKIAEMSERTAATFAVTVKICGMIVNLALARDS